MCFHTPCRAGQIFHDTFWSLSLLNGLTAFEDSPTALVSFFLLRENLTVQDLLMLKVLQNPSQYTCDSHSVCVARASICLAAVVSACKMQNMFFWESCSVNALLPLPDGLNESCRSSCGGIKAFSFIAVTSGAPQLPK